MKPSLVIIIPNIAFFRSCHQKFPIWLCFSRKLQPFRISNTICKFETTRCLFCNVLLHPEKIAYLFAVWFTHNKNPTNVEQSICRCKFKCSVKGYPYYMYNVNTARNMKFIDIGPGEEYKTPVFLLPSWIDGILTTRRVPPLSPTGSISSCSCRPGPWASSQPPIGLAYQCRGFHVLNA